MNKKFIVRKARIMLPVFFVFFLILDVFFSNRSNLIGCLYQLSHNSKLSLNSKSNYRTYIIFPSKNTQLKAKTYGTYPPGFIDIYALYDLEP